MNERRMVQLVDGRVGKVVRVDTTFPDNTTTLTIWTNTSADGSPVSSGPVSNGPVSNGPVSSGPVSSGSISGPGIAKVSLSEVLGEAARQSA